ncbi:hypothetical protein B0J17DRAFT_230454 [Rhizoctonia solani]|nr:hypothetical protein B0J17DRAFT_230454 [Rhizoctonia solani]
MRVLYANQVKQQTRHSTSVSTLAIARSSISHYFSLITTVLICLLPSNGAVNHRRTHSPLQTEEAEGTHSALVSCSAEIKGCDVRYSSADVASIQDKVRRNELASGRYWIRFHQKLDGASFMAYMALQNIKTVCIISNQKSLMSAYAKALESITKFTVFHPTNPGCLQLTDPLVQSFITSASPAILLLSPDRPLEISLMDLHMDCVVYWGMPWSAEYYRSRVLACSPLNIPACLILTTPGVGLDPESYGTIEYPVAFLKSISGPFKNVSRCDCGWQELRVSCHPFAGTFTRSCQRP